MKTVEGIISHNLNNLFNDMSGDIISHVVIAAYSMRIDLNTKISPIMNRVKSTLFKKFLIMKAISDILLIHFWNTLSSKMNRLYDTELYDVNINSSIAIDNIREYDHKNYFK